MNNRLFATLGSLTLLATTAAFAQTAQQLEAKVPFEFYVGAKRLPAGECNVTYKGEMGALIIRCAGNASVITLTTALQTMSAPEKGSLVFNRYGDTYFLARIWAPGESMGRQLFKTKVEREWANNRSEPSTVTVAMTRH